MQHFTWDELCKCTVLRLQWYGCGTIEPVFFAHHLFHEFHDLGALAKVTGLKYSFTDLHTSAMVQQAKTPKLKAPE